MGLARREEGLPPTKPSPRRRDADSPRRCFVIPKGAGKVHNLLESSLKIESLTHSANSKELKAAVVTVEPGGYSEETEIYLGDKWCYVLEGTLEIRVTDAQYLLSEGDSIYLEYTAPHTWCNPTARPTRALVLSSPVTISV